MKRTSAGHVDERPPLRVDDLPACVLEAGVGDPIGPLSVDEYFRMPETHHRESLVYGWLVREPSASSAHQVFGTGLILTLGRYVDEQHLGVLFGQCDVVLDEAKRLVVQPDAMVILRDRRHIIRTRRVYGAPNIAIEARSPRTARRDRTVKLEWYRTYGVQEYWMVDVDQKRIEVFDLTVPPEPTVTCYGDGDLLRSRVLPDFACPVAKVFEPVFRYVYTSGPGSETEE